jgi:uncharacterized protein with PIN domain
MDRSRQARLVEEHLDEFLLARQVRVQAFDGNEALKPAGAQYPSQKDGGHTARSEFGDELVPIEPLLTPSV